MKNPVFTGAGVAIITPMYEDGSINFDELGRIVEDQIARGTDAIVICGTTGECSTMTDEEQLAAIKYTVDLVNHRVPVIAMPIPVPHTRIPLSHSLLVTFSQVRTATSG